MADSDVDKSAPAKLTELSATALVDGIRARRYEAQDVLGACLRTIEEREPITRAWQVLREDGVLASDSVDDGGRLYGVPVGIKDIIDTSDLPTALGSPIYSGRLPSSDAACVARIRAAGGLVPGKTVTTELAYFSPGPTRNPHNPLHTPGGSSSGSAAAVADCMVPLAIGTQTAASLIRPAAYCGVIGYKSSVGWFSLAGIKTFSQSLDSLGIFSRHVGDIVMLSEVLAGVRSPLCRAAPSAPAFGFVKTPVWTDVEDSSRELLWEFVGRLRAAGASVEELEFPGDFTALVQAHKTIMAFEAARNYSFEYLFHRDALSEPLRMLLEAGNSITFDAYEGARLLVASGQRTMARALDSLDALLTPSAAGTAPLAEHGTGDPLFSRVWTALGLPSINIPIGLAECALPVGAQLVGRHFGDWALLRVAEWVEQSGSLMLARPARASAVPRLG